MRKDKRKVYIYDKEGNLIKVARDKESAAHFAKTSVSSVIRSLKGISTFSQCGYYFRWNDELGKVEHKSTISRAVLQKDKDGNIIKRYLSMSEASKELKISVSSISYLISGHLNKNNFINRYGCYFELSKGDEVVEETENVENPKRQEYFINVLVGLVNGTLIDGAIYTINGLKYTYNKSKEMLTRDGEFGISKKNYIEVCDIELPLLTTEEKEFLKSLKKNLRDIETIIKCKNYNGMEYIRLQGSITNLDLDEFKVGSQYAGLKLNQVYSLEDLDIK